MNTPDPAQPIETAPNSDAAGDARAPADAAAGRRVSHALLVAGVLNLAYFGVEAVAGLFSGSAALMADSADFAEDAIGCFILLLAVGTSVLARRGLAVLQAVLMIVVALAAIRQVQLRLGEGGVPDAGIMVVVAIGALAVNLYSAWLLAPLREGPQHLRAAWIAARADAFGNLAILGAAGLIFATKAAWPDIVAGGVIAALNIWAAMTIFWQRDRLPKSS